MPSSSHDSVAAGLFRPRSPGGGCFYKVMNFIHSFTSIDGSCAASFYDDFHLLSPAEIWVSLSPLTFPKKPCQEPGFPKFIFSISSFWHYFWFNVFVFYFISFSCITLNFIPRSPLCILPVSSIERFTCLFQTFLLNDESNYG